MVATLDMPRRPISVDLVNNNNKYYNQQNYYRNGESIAELLKASIVIPNVMLRRMAGFLDGSNKTVAQHRR
jgi:hypothetical protein